ncbi:MASE1 domain-containing protein [Bordetella genomosp. 9]|uniref:MASE1 domain-containing protein n=1 Tax=Bordetella genomosp. 9 TaxID=1416803 RepID=A0A1W6Z0E3_9BORD|nr:MASE1 domain-containing protein [Bordetella genomosp. 9]ARP86847.1 hypothetical protein CAL13_11990 [Bordetella genomosp. 9]
MNRQRQWASIGFALAYAALAGASMLRRDTLNLSTLFWPPAGLLLAALMLDAPRRWPAWMALAASLHIVTGIVVGQRSFPVAAVFALADLLFCAAVAAACRPRTHGAAEPASLPVTLRFIGVLALCSVAGGILTAFILRAIGQASSPTHWYVWSMAAFVGCIIATPLVMAGSRLRWRALAEQSVARLWFGLLAAFAMLGGTTIVFNDPARAAGRFVWHDGFGMSYGPLLFLAIVALCWGPAGSALTVAGLALVAGSYTLSGMGPYANIAHFSGQPLLAVQGYLGCAAILSLIIGALAADRERALQRAAALTSQLESALRVSGQVAWEFRRAGSTLHWLGELPHGIASGRAVVPLDDWLSRVHPDEQERLRVWLHTGADSYAFRRLRFRVLGNDGRYHEMELSGSARHGVPDRMTGLLGTPGEELPF